MRRLLSMLLALAMVLSLMAGMCFTVSAESTVITEVRLTGQLPPVPVKGGTAQNFVWSAPADAGYHLGWDGKIPYYNLDEGRDLEAGETFGFGNYVTEAAVIADEGYIFDPNVQVYLGDVLLADAGFEVIVTEDGGNVWLDRFDVLEPEYIEGASITGSPIPQLQVGDTLPELSYTVPEGANYTVETYWWKNGMKVPAGTAVEDGNDYRLWIDVYVTEGYAFTHGFPLMINGEEHSFVHSNALGDGFEGCRFYKEYPFLTAIDKVEISYTAAVVDQPLSDVTVAEGALYTADMEWYDYNDDENSWKDPGAVAVKGHKYEGTIDIYPNKGYMFTADTEIWVNGEKITEDYAHFLDVNYNNIRIETPDYDFTEAVAKVEVTYTEPALGKALPVPAVTGDNCEMEYYHWMNAGAGEIVPDDAVVEKGYRYELLVIVKPAAGYIFTEDTKITVNGVQSDTHNIVVDEDSVHYYSHSYTFAEELSEVFVTYAEPVLGQPLAVPEVNSTLYEMTVCQWYDVDEEREVAAGTVVQKGHKYELYCEIEPAFGYKFTDDTQLSVNGKVLKNGENYSIYEDYLCYGKQYAFTEKITVVSAQMEDPVLGQPFPQATVPADANYTVTTIWYEGYTGEVVTGNVGNNVYNADIIIEPKFGFEFAEKPNVTFNGKVQGERDYDLGRALWLYEVYSFAQSIEKIEVFYEKPEAGKAPGAVTVPQGANYSLKEEDTGWFYSVSREKVTGVFEDGYRYYMEARVELAPGYQLERGFTELCINGKAYIYNGGGGNWLETAVTIPGEEFSLAQSVDKVELPAWPELKVGDELPAITGESEYYEYYYRWDALDADGEYVEAYTVEENMVYCIELVAGPKAGYEFDENTVVTVGGKPVSNWGDVGHSVISDCKVYNFGGAKEVKTVNMITSVPGIGQSGGEVTIPADVGCTMYDLIWGVASDTTYEDADEISGPYKTGDRVLLMVDLLAKPGYVFDSEMTVTVNGKEYPVVDGFSWYNYNYVILDLGEVKKNTEYNGLVEVGGVWGYYEGGVLQTDYTGLVPYGDLIFYVENGILDFSYTGLAWYNDAWTYVANSQLTEGYTGLVWFNDNWFYTVDSVIDWTFTGLVPYEGNMFYVQNNRLDWSYTGLAYLNDGWYYVENALLKPDYTGLTYFNENWFYVVDGTIDWSFTGMVPYNDNYFYVQNNLLDWSYTGLGYHDGAWYYFQNALYTPTYNGMVDFNGGIFYLEGGVIDWSVNGLREHEGDLYYFVNSAFDATFNGTAEYDGVTYEVVNGVVDL